MKKATASLVGVMLALLVSGTAFAQIKVTFKINASTYPDTLRPNHVVQIRGGVDGAGSTTPAITWDAGSAAATSNGGDYWTLTLESAAGTKLNYKFWAGYSTSKPLTNKGPNYSEEGWEAGPNRSLTVPAKDTTINVWMGHTANVNPFRAKVDSVGVMFRVNAGARVQARTFDPAKDIVEVRGGTAPLTWGGDTKAKLALEPFRVGDNYMYSGIVYFPKTSGAATSPYKYFANDWEGGDNKTFNAKNDTTIHWTFFNNEVPSSAPIITAQATFQVNTGYMNLLNLYSENVGDRVTIRGGGIFGGWAATSDDANALTFDDADKFYKVTKQFVGPAGSSTAYKFYIDYDDSRLTQGGPNFLPAYFADQGGFGYEEPLSTLGGNRIYTQNSNSTRVEPKVYFNDVPPSAVILKDNFQGGASSIKVIFRVDMSPAMALTGANKMVDGDSVFFSLESKLTGLTLGMQSATRQTARNFLMTREAGTNIWRYELVIDEEATINDFGFNFFYGKPGLIDGNWEISGNRTFDAGRRYYQFVRPLAVQPGVLDPVLGMYYEATWPAEFTMPLLQWTNGAAPGETAPDYEALSSERGGRVNGFELMANYPNPFNPSTTIQFRTPAAGRVTLEVFNVLGQKVATLINNEVVPAGTHARAFDAAKLSSGMYIYRLSANGFTSQRKMMLVK